MARKSQKLRAIAAPAAQGVVNGATGDTQAVLPQANASEGDTSAGEGANPTPQVTANQAEAFGTDADTEGAGLPDGETNQSAGSGADAEGLEEEWPEEDCHDRAEYPRRATVRNNSSVPIYEPTFGRSVGPFASIHFDVESPADARALLKSMAEAAATHSVNRNALIIEGLAEEVKEKP